MRNTFLWVYRIAKHLFTCLQRLLFSSTSGSCKQCEEKLWKKGQMIYRIEAANFIDRHYTQDSLNGCNLLHQHHSTLLRAHKGAFG
jgi:hypothetical protein